MTQMQVKTGAAALAALAVLTSCSNDDPATGPNPPDNEPPPTSTPTPDYKPIPDEGGFIAPGRWAIRADESPETPLAVIDVPTGGFNGGERWVWTSEGTIGYWTVSGVHKDPCTRSAPAASAGDTVEDLAEALDAQNRTTATQPLPVVVDGHDGLYLEVSTPTKAGSGRRHWLDYRTCREDGLVLWDDAPALDGPTVTRLWILDVDGRRVVMALNGGGTKETVFTDMVESAEFVKG